MRLPLSVAASVLVSVACHAGGQTSDAVTGPLRITEAFAFQPVTKDEAAVYFEIKNSGDQPDTLVSAASPIAAEAMIHGMSAEGMAAMSGLEIPARGMIQLQPGQLHLMLSGLQRIPQSGEHIGLTLNFRRAGPVTFEVPVRPYGR